VIEIIHSGLLSSLQDKGRHGLRHLGIPWSGVLVPAWMRIANALVGNAEDAPIIEWRIAIVGDATVTADDGTTVTTLACWRSHTLATGTLVRVQGTGDVRVAVIAIYALNVPLHHNSRSTYVKASLGGLNGAALSAGDQLLVERIADGPDLQCKAFTPPLTEPTVHSTTSLRAVAGPQADAFSPHALDKLTSATYTLTASVDRMGARLDGPALEHRDSSHRDIVSDAIVPGSVQVPGNGLPIVLLALPLLALRRPGAAIHFAWVTTDEGIDIARAAEAALLTHLGGLQIVNEARIDAHTLMSRNLIDGVTDGS